MLYLGGVFDYIAQDDEQHEYAYNDMHLAVHHRLESGSDRNIRVCEIVCAISCEANELETI